METKILSTFENVLEFYSTNKINQQENALHYINAKKIKRKNSLGALRISRILKISASTINNWLMGKKTPRAIKGLDQLKSMKLLPLLTSNSPEFSHFMRVLGLRYSDGCIYEQIRNNSFTFHICFGSKIDALSLAKDSKTFWNIDIEPKYSPKANAYYVYFPSCLARLMLSVGSLKGVKTEQDFKLPEWIFELSDSLKIEFLRGLFSGDGDTPRLKASGNGLESLKLSLSSEANIVESFCSNFMYDVYKLIVSLGIKASKPKIMYNQSRHSESGKVTYPVHIRILTKKNNIIQFLEKIKYTYRNKALERREFILNKFMLD